jgi:hypothetical protein
MNKKPRFPASLGRLLALALLAPGVVAADPAVSAETMALPAQRQVKPIVRVSSMIRAEATAMAWALR